MKTVAILGPTGMLGSAVYAQLKDKYKLILVLRDSDKLPLLYDKYGKCENLKVVLLDTENIFNDFKKGFHTEHKSETTAKLLEEIGDVDAVINCIGITNRYSNERPLDAFFINSTLPYLFSWQYGDKFIHITTDCVFSGINGAPYDENSLKSPNDLYGLTKSLGEPSDKSLVLRTSIIGPEITGYVSLMEWFKKQGHQTIKGYKTHLWNGITTREYGNICDRIISNRDKFPKSGLFHIFSTDISKYEMLNAFKEKYQIDVTIEPDEPDPIDRRLRTIHNLCKILEIPSFSEMIKEL